MTGPEQTAVAFGRACDHARVPYILVGGLAVGAWGQPRATTDVIVILDPVRVADLVSALRREGLELDPRDFDDALSDGSHVTVHDPRSRYHVDVKPARDEGERSQVEAGVVLALGAGALRVARSEDTVAFKLAFGSPRTSRTRARSLFGRRGGWIGAGSGRSRPGSA